MKDRQIQSKPESGSIPILSPLLHILSMPTLVFLRNDFGYTFLRPKSIFLSLCFATVLFIYYSWHEPGMWEKNMVVCIFLGAAVGLYLSHLYRAMSSQFSKPKHDHFAGRSRLILFSKDQELIRIAIEPAIVALAAFYVHSSHPNQWLLYSILKYSALSLFAKEAINRWHSVRKVRRQVDAMDDAENSISIAHQSREAIVSQTSTGSQSRKKRIPRRRANPLSEDELREHYAQILRLLPPYTLDQANKNYQKLRAEVDHSNEAASKKLQLEKAIEYFRSEET